jgi:hypothetical protein
MSVAKSTLYLHVLDGRMRVNVPRVKNAPQVAEALERSLGAVDGITGVTANVATGNVLILSNPDIMTPEQIVHLLEREGYCESLVQRVNKVGSTEIENAVARFMVHTLVRVGVKAAISALF